MALQMTLAACKPQEQHVTEWSSSGCTRSHSCHVPAGAAIKSVLDATLLETLMGFPCAVIGGVFGCDAGAGAAAHPCGRQDA